MSEQTLIPDKIIDPTDEPPGDAVPVNVEDGGGHAAYYDGDGRLVPATARDAIGPAPRTRGTSALSVRPDQAWWSDEQLRVLASRGIVQGTERGHFTRASMEALLHQSAVTGLDALTGEIIPIQGWRKLDGGGVVAEVAFVISIGSLQGRAQATGQYRGMEGPEFLDEVGNWTGEWTLPGHPVAARCKIHREGWAAAWTIVYWEETVPRIPEFREEGGHRVPTGQWVEPQRWRDRPIGLLGKCVKAAGIRDTFADAVAGFYIPEEMERAQHTSAQSHSDDTASSQRVDRAERLAVLASAGRAGAEVIPGQVAGDDDGRASLLIEQAQTRIAAARSSASGADSGSDLDEQDRQALLWLEIDHAAHVMGWPLESLFARQITLWGPVDTWSSTRMLSAMGPLRTAVAGQLERRGELSQARAYRESGPLLVASLEVLLGGVGGIGDGSPA